MSNRDANIKKKEGKELTLELKLINSCIQTLPSKQELYMYVENSNTTRYRQSLILLNQIQGTKCIRRCYKYHEGKTKTLLSRALAIIVVQERLPELMRELRKWRAKMVEYAQKMSK